MQTSRLGTLIGTVLRRERYARALTQHGLAERAGTSQAAVARIERGDRAPSLAMVERLFEAMDVQLTVAVEPLDAQLDARIDELATRPVADRIDELGLDRMRDRLAGLPYLFAGATAACLQGAPVPVEAPEIAVRRQDSRLLAAWLNAGYAQRWNARWEAFGGLPVEPEEPGEHRWWTRYGEIRATLCDELPEALEVRHAGRSYPVVPLVRVEVSDPRAAGLLHRYRSRQAGGDRGGNDGRSAG